MSKRNEMKQVAVPSVEQVENELKKIRYQDLFRKTLSSTVATLIVVAAIAVLVSTLFLPVIQVSGNSMAPSLQDGDILVLMKKKDCDYGDLCCVSWQNKLLLKRVIGLPGDTIIIDGDGNVYVNDKLLDEPYLTEKSQGECDIEFPYTVPDNRIFILGDARESSVDSRSNAIGCIEKDQIIGSVLWNVWNAK